MVRVCNYMYMYELQRVLAHSYVAVRIQIILKHGLSLKAQALI